MKELANKLGYSYQAWEYGNYFSVNLCTNGYEPWVWIYSIK